MHSKTFKLFDRPIF